MLTTVSRWCFLACPSQPFEISGYVIPGVTVRLSICCSRKLRGVGGFAAKSGIIAGRTVNSNSSSTSAVTLIKKWVHECTTHHEFCAVKSTETNAVRGLSSSRLPTRVIEVEQDATTGMAGSLVVPSEGSYGTYATLSHCWGKLQQFTTTSANLADRMRGFRMDQLSKTMQDAVIITRELGLRYLWIDSINIIQDDRADWESESARMAEVYQNAFINLAATASPDGSKGMLFDRISQRHVQITAGPMDSDTTELSFYVSQHQTYYNDPIRRTPLNERGWVLQERTLSPRIAHFSEDQLFWECHSQFASEDNQYDTTLGQDLRGRTHLYLPVFLKAESEIPSERTKYKQRSQLDYWIDLVVEYSRKKLTKDFDVFAALAGIAILVSKTTGDDYVAGMWRSTLHTELLWIALKAPLRAPKQWRAPSWSWASRIGEITYEGHQQWAALKKSAQFLDAVTEWTGQPFSSRISSGKLIVRGLVEIASYDPEPTDYHLYDIDTYRLKPENDSENTNRYTYRWAVFDNIPPPVEQLIYCLCIFVDQDKDEHWVLLLEKTHESPDEYRRIGAGRIDMEREKFAGGNSHILTII